MFVSDDTILHEQAAFLPEILETANGGALSHIQPL